ncbi:DUF4876 domain-containing protein [Chitinophaga rhizophila]|uniref:DUF4876 domain-containing protein n=1 Tax=Chitinophaga rhizophila TaxID=2866212 RepID=A0ABS7G8I2_9BACT|nr:DUF4876 domain-containing protein [Chitinophaga rhizophila]MBW8682858.1 DUF4876 domain-containing protein [Chitinophaga rhizophila]
MKKISYLLLLIITAAISCKKEDTISTGIRPVDVTVNLSYGLDSSKYKLPVGGITVKMTNTNSGTVQTATSNDSGRVRFTNVQAGAYDIDAMVTIADTTYYRITGNLIEENITFNASEKNTRVAVGDEIKLNLTLVAGTVGDWVIKQIYYAGSHTTQGALYRDQFIELYNNTDKVLYADSIYIGQLFGRQSLTRNNTHVLPNGQVDWTHSVGMNPNIDANNDYVYTRSILMVPGNGTTYPVQPGSSIIIAQTALNHKTPFTGANGNTISVKDPSLTVDLSGADFEAYYGDFAGSPLASDIDNPEVPNMVVYQYNGRDYILDNPGRDAYIIFKVDASQNVRNWPSYPLPTLAPPPSTADYYIQVPNQYIIDGVEVQPSAAEDRIPKKLNAAFDAGFTFVPKGSYSSQSVIRKTARTVNGRIILKDTNNSTEDFDYLDFANPRGFK